MLVKNNRFVSNMEEQTSPQAPTKAASSTPPPQRNSLAVPVAILAGFGMIAAAIYFSGGNRAAVPVPVGGLSNEPEARQLVPAPEINEDDHILGDPNAPIVIVEYSDFDCPYCKVFHESMHQVIDKYGSKGQVAWVYRHFPIASRHPSAAYIAAASECVAELGGNEAFWTFTDQVFQEREINELTDTTKLPDFAVTAGVNVTEFEACLESERTMPLVEADYADGVNAGVTGTPYSFLMIAGQQLPINGAEAFEYLDANIQNLLKQIESAE